MTQHRGRLARLTASLGAAIVAFGAYLAMFPHLIAGPIVRYRLIREALHARAAAATVEVHCCAILVAEVLPASAAAAARGIRFVDAPVAGSRGPAQKGELVFFAGGDAADVDRYGGAGDPGSPAGSPVDPASTSQVLWCG